MTESDHDGVRGAGAAWLDRRRLILGAFGLTAASLASILDSKPASAHHGWPGFDTSRLIYLAGAISLISWTGVVYAGRLLAYT